MESKPRKIVTRPERESIENISSTVNMIHNNKLISDILDSVPVIIFILNEFRQILFCNKAYLELSRTDPKELVLGLRPGEIFGCAFHLESEKGCGESMHCRYCGAVAAVRQSRAKNTSVTNEARLTILNSNQEIAVDFQVTAAPFVISGLSFTLLTLQDISHEKRRKILERAFFHDFIDKISTLQYTIDLLNPENINQQGSRFYTIAQRLTQELVSEVIGHRVLLNAENNELYLNLSEIESEDIILKSVEQIRNHNVSEGKTIEVSPKSAKFNFESDYLLLNRILINMLKNALEATEPGKSVSIYSEKYDDKAIFSVHNDVFMNEEMSNQIFQRSFSTKGKDRGIGTYSIKLLGEQYLKGKVWFTTDKVMGTSFHLAIPLKLNDDIPVQKS